MASRSSTMHLYNHHSPVVSSSKDPFQLSSSSSSSLSSSSSFSPSHLIVALDEESNPFNSLMNDGCADGNSGTYENDESVEFILVKSRDIPIENLRAGGPVRISAGVYAYDNADRVDFYLSNNPEAGKNTIWTRIGTVDPDPPLTFPGLTLAQVDTNLLDTPLQAVRVIVRWSSGTNQAEALECPTNFTDVSGNPGTFSDTDDMAFKVDVTAGIGLSQLSPVNSIQSLEMPPATVTDCPTLSDK